MNADELDKVGLALEHSGMSDDEIDSYFLEHFGVKGMKWGVRRQVSRSERSAGRKELRDTAKTAGKIIKEARRARTNEERQAAANRYEKEVIARIKSPAWKKAYQDANTMGKGEMAAHILTSGPFAALTIPAIKAQYSRKQTYGAGMELGAAKAILDEMRTI